MLIFSQGKNLVRIKVIKTYLLSPFFCAIIYVYPNTQYNLIFTSRIFFSVKTLSFIDLNALSISESPAISLTLEWKVL